MREDQAGLEDNHSPLWLGNPHDCGQCKPSCSTCYWKKGSSAGANTDLLGFQLLLCSHLNFNIGIKCTILTWWQTCCGSETKPDHIEQVGHYADGLESRFNLKVKHVLQNTCSNLAFTARTCIVVTQWFEFQPSAWWNLKWTRKFQPSCTGISIYCIHSNRHSCPNRRSPSFIMNLMARKNMWNQWFLYKKCMNLRSDSEPIIMHNFISCSCLVHYN